MVSLLRVLLCLCLPLLAGTACRKTTTTRASTAAIPDTLIPGTFITSPGTYHGHEGRYTRTIKLSQTGNQVGWTLTTKVIGPREATGNHASSSSLLALSSPSDPWFVYVESPGRLWLCDGHANLYVNFIGSTGDNDYRQLVNSRRLTPGKPLPAPKPVFDRLPESIRRILPAPETPVVKPSI
jgi:hypothetical protein